MTLAISQAITPVQYLNQPKFLPGYSPAVFICGAKICYCNERMLPNQSAATALHLINQGIPLIINVLNEETQFFFNSLQNPEVVCFVSEVGTEQFLNLFWKSLTGLSSTKQLSGINFLLYESFTEYLPPDRKSRPFLGVLEEDFAHLVPQMATKRAVLVQQCIASIKKLHEDMNLKECTILFISSLAAHRGAGMLSLDTIHKVVGSALLESAAIEMGHICPELQIKYVEILPGFVEGLYDDRAANECLMLSTPSHIPVFGQQYGLDNFPQLSADNVGEIAALYLLNEEMPDNRLRPELRSLLLAGRSSFEELSRLVNTAIHFESRSLSVTKGELPQYVLTKGATFGKLPSPSPGEIVRVNLTPQGQMF